MRGVSVVIGLAISGCAADADKVMSADGGDTGTSSEASGGADGTMDSGGVDDGAVEPVWWRLQADLMLSGGAPVLADSTMSVAVLDDTGAELCALSAPLSSAEPEADPPQEWVITWWQVSVDAWQGDCDAWGTGGLIPLEMVVGIGRLHPEIVAVVGRMPEYTGGSPSSLNGTYARFADAETLFVFGAAGLEQAWQGVGEAAGEAPLPDGLWLVRGAYGFPI